MAYHKLRNQVTVAQLKDGIVEKGDYAIANVRGKQLVIIYLGTAKPYESEPAHRIYNAAYSSTHRGKLKKEYREPLYKGAEIKPVYTSDDQYKWAMYESATDVAPLGSVPSTRDPAVMKHLEKWLAAQVKDEALRDKVRAAMLKLYDEDPEYWGEKSWWDLYDRAGCAKLGVLGGEPGAAYSEFRKRRGF